MIEFDDLKIEIRIGLYKCDSVGPQMITLLSSEVIYVSFQITGWIISVCLLSEHHGSEDSHTDFNMFGKLQFRFIL